MRMKTFSEISLILLLVGMLMSTFHVGLGSVGRTAGIDPDGTNVQREISEKPLRTYRSASASSEPSPLVARVATMLQDIGNHTKPTIAVNPRNLSVRIKFDPNFWDWDNPAPPYWLVYVRAGDTADFPARDIDGNSIVFEGTVQAEQDQSYIYKGACVAKLNGQGVMNIIASKIGHMGVPPRGDEAPIKYEFTVTGKLKDGTPIAGTGWIKLRFPGGVPPPLPPP